MSADTRSVSTDALATLGTIIDDSQKRDAIHLAVIPMLAKHVLHAGQHVDKGGQPAKLDECVGIVDPFLREPVAPGQYFWLVIYPRVITSLRHVWAHPEFADEPAAEAATDKSASEAWMRKWATEHMGTDYYGDNETRSEDSAYADAIEAGRRNHIGPYEDARDHIDSEWWAHWEFITGLKGNRDEYFSCSC